MWARLAVLLLAPVAPLAQAEACEPCDSYPNGPVPSDATSLCQKLEGDVMKCYATQGDGNCGIGDLCTGPPVTQVRACTCTSFTNQAWYEDTSLCEKENGECYPSNGGNCGQDTLCMGPMTHHDFPVCPCSSPDFRNGAELYDVFSCYDSSQGKCAPVQESRAQCTVCKESVECDTSECGGNLETKLCRKKMRFDCCMAEEQCSELTDVYEHKNCFFDCCGDTGIGGRCWGFYDEVFMLNPDGCDTSGCADGDGFCHRKTRQECCLANKGCGAMDEDCFKECCSFLGYGNGRCGRLYDAIYPEIS